MAHIYNFSIIRICPDARRGELVNIGLLVFLPSGVDVRILPSLAKVHALHGELDLSELHALPEKFAAIIPRRKSVADRHRLSKRIGMVELSELGQFQADGNEQYELVLDQLMRKLVKPTVGTRDRYASGSKLHQQVRRIIKDAHLMGRRAEDIDNHKVISDYPIAPDKGLYADFAGKNSRFYFTETVDFRVDRGILGPKLNESAKAAFVLREAQRQFSNSNRALVYAATSKMEASLHPHLNLMQEFATDVLNFASAQDRARYITKLTSALGGQLPNMAPRQRA